MLQSTCLLLTEILKQDPLNAHFGSFFSGSDPPQALEAEQSDGQATPGDPHLHHLEVLHLDVLKEAFLHTHTETHQYTVRIFLGQHLIHVRASHTTS